METAQPSVLAFVTSANGLALSVSILMILTGVVVLKSVKSGEPLQPYLLQILGMLFILPVVLIMAVTIGIGKEAVTGILGTIVGYVFSTSKQLDIKPKEMSEKPKKEENKKDEHV